MTDHVLQTGGESRHLSQHGVGAGLERRFETLHVLGGGQCVDLLTERLLELRRVLLDVLQGRRGGGTSVALHNRRVALKYHRH